MERLKRENIEEETNLGEVEQQKLPPPPHHRCSTCFAPCLSCKDQEPRENLCEASSVLEPMVVPSIDSSANSSSSAGGQEEENVEESAEHGIVRMKNDWTKDENVVIFFERQVNEGEGGDQQVEDQVMEEAVQQVGGPGEPPRQKVHKAIGKKDGNKEHFCECGSCFKFACLLAGHVNRLTKNKPFKCSRRWCGAAFFDVGGWKNHMDKKHNTGTSEVKIGCRRDGEMFPDKTTFSRHCNLVHNSWGGGKGNERKGRKKKGTKRVSSKGRGELRRSKRKVPGVVYTM